jgi:hypothetical protein
MHICKKHVESRMDLTPTCTYVPTYKHIHRAGVHAGASADQSDLHVFGTCVAAHQFLQLLVPQCSIIKHKF